MSHNWKMSASHAELLRTVDPMILGNRIRDARMAAGLTQGQVSGDELTVSYLSRIERGGRRPRLAVLRTLAQRLDVTLDELLRGVTATEYDEIRLGLDYAELALETGEATDAERQARSHLARAEAARLSDLAQRGRFLLGRSLEALGLLDEAIAEFDRLLASASGVLAIRTGIALSRCYRNCDDLNLAIEAGERVQNDIADDGLAGTDEAVQLAVTIAAAYAFRGDLGYAIRLCEGAIQQAEELASPTARAAAYWNASIFQSERGEVAEALPLAERALALLGEGHDTRNIAQLRIQLGRMQLELDPSLLDDALENMTRGRAELASSSASQGELAWGDLSIARALLFSGESARALELATTARDQIPVRSSVEFADASLVVAEALLASGRGTEAHEACLAAVNVLGANEGPDRTAAQVWYELADLLEELGDRDTAWTAVRNAATASGLKGAQQTNRRQRQDSTVPR